MKSLTQKINGIFAKFVFGSVLCIAVYTLLIPYIMYLGVRAFIVKDIGTLTWSLYGYFVIIYLLTDIATFCIKKIYELFTNGYKNALGAYEQLNKIEGLDCATKEKLINVVLFDEEISEEVYDKLKKL